MSKRLFSPKVLPDWQGLRDCILRKGTPKRVYNMELLSDQEVQDAVCERFDLTEKLSESDPYYEQKKQVSLMRFLGYDYIRGQLDHYLLSFDRLAVGDTAGLKRKYGREYIEEHKGPITSWEEFESYPWPNLNAVSTRALEWYENNLPDDMCILALSCFAHFTEYLTWLMGYETLCFSLYDQPDLVRAISDKILDTYRLLIGLLLDFDRIKIFLGADDMGHRTSTLISPDSLREFALPGHKEIAARCHDAGRPYILHTCGNLNYVARRLMWRKPCKSFRHRLLGLILTT